MATERELATLSMQLLGCTRLVPTPATAAQTPTAACVARASMDPATVGATVVGDAFATSLDTLSRQATLWSHGGVSGVEGADGDGGAAARDATDGGGPRPREAHRTAPGTAGGQEEGTSAAAEEAAAAARASLARLCSALSEQSALARSLCLAHGLARH